MNKIYIACYRTPINSLFSYAIVYGRFGIGTVLTTHISSDEGFAMHDMGVTSTEKHHIYRDHFNDDAYELVWLGVFDNATTMLENMYIMFREDEPDEQPQ